MPKYARAHDLESWQHDSRIAAHGFAHRWESSVAPGNGEDAFIDLVDRYLRADMDVLDLGCGHGEFTLLLAPRCRTIVGVERDPGYLELARTLAAEQNAANVRFHQVNLAGVDDEDRTFAGLPLPDSSIDLFINRRGPLLQRYLGEALRVARPGARILGLHPTGNVPSPPWRGRLPEPYRDIFFAHSFDHITRWVTAPLEAAGISDYSLWWIDVPEYLRTPHELYARLPGIATGDLLPYAAMEPVLADIFADFGTAQGVVLRHQRLLWLAHLPA